ncbi:MAG: acetate--CoA ligase family protein [Anaerolineales bacterium]|nr:acetate--CoA ligase family protein [Anaerolineales bacterium]
MEPAHLRALLHPASIAVIGASNNPKKIGYALVHNLLESGYRGKVYPINPTSDEIQGLTAYSSVTDVPGEIDSAVITVPAAYALTVTEECGVKGVKNLIVITSGFSEVGQDELENTLLQTAKQFGMRVLGPNVVGILSNAEKMNASFAAFLPFPGKASIISQSGALLVAIIAATYTRGIGFNEMVSIGNMSDLQFSDLIEVMDQDEATSCISLYIESLNDGRRFIETCRKASKPIIVLKAGTSARGAAAAASHTGSLAGVARVYEAAFEQAGVLQAVDVNNLLDRTLALSLQPPMQGDNIAILSNGGGVGVLSADAAERFGIPASEMPQDLQAGIMNFIPSYGSARNPVDLTGMGDAACFYEITRLTLSHPWVDGLVIQICESQMLDLVEIVKGIHRGLEETGIHDKPVAVSLIGGERAEEASRWMIEHGIPAYDSPDLAINAMAALREYARIRAMMTGSPAPIDQTDVETARNLIARVRAAGRPGLTEIESRQIFEAYSLPVVKTRLAVSEGEALTLAREIGYPVVMKIVSPDILHKSDAGGVMVNISDDAAVRQAYKTILENAADYNADARLCGVAIQEMADPGTEVIIGSTNDPTFGPTVMFGLGGVFVEALKDVTFRVAPVSPHQAQGMLTEIRGAAVLHGTRGEAPRDQAALATTISRYSYMVADLGDEIAESDANPCLVYAQGQGVRIVDARVILKEPGSA